MGLNFSDDLLVMGTKGRKGGIARFLGSQTSRIMEDINCPILVIPQHAEFTLTSSVACAIDFETKIKLTDLQLLENLVNAGSNNSVKLIHVIRVSKALDNKLPLEQFNNFKVRYNEIIGDNVSTLLEGYTNITKSRLLCNCEKRERLF